MPRTNLLALLTGGDRRSIGNSHRVCALVLADTTLLAPLVRHMRASDPVVCMRAADAMEKISVKRASGLQPFTPGLLGLADETVQPEVRWHLALMLPRLQLKSPATSESFRTPPRISGRSQLHRENCSVARIVGPGWRRPGSCARGPRLPRARSARWYSGNESACS
jgi:hypothetical protein